MNAKNKHFAFPFISSNVLQDFRLKYNIHRSQRANCVSVKVLNLAFSLLKHCTDLNCFEYLIDM